VGSQYTGAALNQAFAPTIGGQVAPQALATAFAPNNGLYNQQLQQTTDQSNAINAMYGLESSPYGAGVTDQNVQNSIMPSTLTRPTFRAREPTPTTR